MRKLANRFSFAAILFAAICTLAQSPRTTSATVIRGWLSDEDCARGRAESGVFTATSPRCAKECVAKGKKIVLIEPERKMIFDISNQQVARKNVGDYVEIAGSINLNAKTVSIGSMKMLTRGTASCSRPALKN
jgi:hypothetical protein